MLRNDRPTERLTAVIEHGESSFETLHPGKGTYRYDPAMRCQGRLGPQTMTAMATGNSSGVAKQIRRISPEDAVAVVNIHWLPVRVAVTGLTASAVSP